MEAIRSCKAWVNFDRIYGVISHNTMLLNEEKYSQETMVANVETKALISFS
jgi:hypothetical protein